MKDLLQQGKWSVPSTIKEEMNYNVFMMSTFNERMLEITETSNITSAMKCLREWKNTGNKPKL